MSVNRSAPSLDSGTREPSLSSHVPVMFLTGGDRERMTANHETYLLMASTQNDMEDWVKTIRRVIWAPFGGGQSTQTFFLTALNASDFIVTACFLFKRQHYRLGLPSLVLYPAE